MLLDKSYFIGLLALPQLGETNVVAHLNVLINTYEPEALQAALGYDLSQAFIEGLEVGSDEEIDQKWIDLRDGAVFTNSSGFKRKWVGFANNSEDLTGLAKQAAKSRSPLAAIVYVNVLCDNALNASQIGIVQTEGENSTKADGSFLMFEKWNQAKRDLEILWEFLLVKTKEVYTEYDSQQIDSNYFKRNKRNPLGI